MASPIVFFDIAGPDDDILQKFYSKLFGWKINSNSQFKVNVISPLEGAIRKDPTEKRIYIGVSDFNQTLNMVKKK